MEAREDIQNQDCSDAASNFERILEVPASDAATSISVQVCFGGCEACALMKDSVKVIFLVDTEGTTVSKAGMYLAGGGTFGKPGDNKMEQVGDTAIWQIVMDVTAWTHHRYDFQYLNNLSSIVEYTMAVAARTHRGPMLQRIRVRVTAICFLYIYIHNQTLTLLHFLLKRHATGTFSATVTLRRLAARRTWPVEHAPTRLYREYARGH